MNYLKRALVSMRQHWMKCLILFVAIFLLASLTASALVTRQAIVSTDYALRAQMPAVVTIRVDEYTLEQHHSSGHDVESVGSVTPPLIREIGAMPYVKVFDYNATLGNFFSETLVRVFDATRFLELDPPDEFVTDWGSLRSWGVYGVEQFFLRGVHHYEVLEIQSGLVDLVAGRTFYPAEIENGEAVVIVSQAFLDENGLSLGNMLELDYRLYAEPESGILDPAFHYSNENLMTSQIFEFEIIGVFDHDLTMEEISDSLHITQHFNILNRIYVPNRIIESILDVHLDFYGESASDFFAELLEADNMEDVLEFDNIAFLLYDPIDIVAFRDAAAPLLPAFWVFSDLSNAYEDLSASMQMLNQVASMMVIGATFATVIALGFLIRLFFHERQHEIGIYLALGEHKIRIVVQLLVEVMVVAAVAIMFALFVGRAVATRMGDEMLRADLARQAAEERNVHVWSNSPEGMGFRHELTHEEMLAMYDVTLDFDTVAMFYGVALTTVFIATVIPTIWVVRMNPKDILLKSLIE